MSVQLACIENLLCTRPRVGECWGNGEGTRGPHVYIFVEESFMKRIEVSRTTDWEATCEDLMLRSCLKEVETA